MQAGTVGVADGQWRAARQAMVDETRQLLDGRWAGGGVRPVYADFNALTLDITTAALFGTGLPRAEAAQVTGALCP